MPKTVIFDFDGTLADTIPSITQVLKITNQIANEMGRKPLTRSEILELRDLSIKESIKKLNIPFYKLPFILKRLRQILKSDTEIAKPVKDIKKTLLALKNKNYTLGIVTSNKKGNVEKFLAKNNLEFFSFIQSGTNIFGKDRVLKKAIKNFKINPKDSIYIGDEIRDIEAARVVDIETVAVCWGFNSEKGLKRAKPKYIAKNPAQIPNFI